jgi:2-dehydro-3-deoxyphosphogluconate aldolase/(4S)-4-hydroxy-2-oxoglutarate aldolase
MCFARFLTMTKQNLVDRIRDSGIIAIMRASSSDQLMAAAEAVLAGGVNAIEVTLTTPGALSVVEQAVKTFGDAVLFGVGTVLDSESARAAIFAGAQFIVSPTLKLETIALCKRYSVPVLPGAYTPTEILTAWEAGADIVKVFPADSLGPPFIKAVKAPLPQVRLCPTGGVSLTNVAEFFKAGADVVGVGGELINNKLLEARDFAEITARASRFREAIVRKLT